ICWCRSTRPSASRQSCSATGSSRRRRARRRRPRAKRNSGAIPVAARQARGGDVEETDGRKQGETTIAKQKAIVTRSGPEEVERRLAGLSDHPLNKDAKPMSVAELQDALRSADVVMPTVSDRITAEVLSATPMRCKILGNFGVGFNHIDIKAARERG